MAAKVQTLLHSVLFDPEHRAEFDSPAWRLLEYCYIHMFIYRNDLHIWFDLF